MEGNRSLSSVVTLGAECFAKLNEAKSSFKNEQVAQKKKDETSSVRRL